MAFVNREKELAQLDDLFQREEAQFVVIYGRRRIGKTSLIQHWVDQHQSLASLHWTAYKTTSSILLESFSAAVSSQMGRLPEAASFNSWESALETIFEWATTESLVIVIDEFPYLIEAVPEFSSLLQIYWDKNHKKSKLFLMICGSQYHMMVEEFLSGKKPLFGRSTANILLREVELEAMSLFLPRYSPSQIVETYGVIGGVPEYLELWDDGKSVMKNIEELILSPVTIFKQEAIFLIQDEIAEPRTYLAMLEAIGAGLKTPTQISEITGVAISHIGKYLQTLLSFDLISRVYSIEDHRKLNPRSGRYEIHDSFLRFYFTYIRPRMNLLEQKREARLLDMIKESFPSFIGKTSYEILCRKRIAFLGDRGELPFIPDEIGRVYDRRLEIDIAAANMRDHQLLVGECKWKTTKMGAEEIDTLIQKASKLAKWKGYNKLYAFFSKTGFTKDMLKRARDEKHLLFEGPELKRVN